MTAKDTSDDLPVFHCHYTRRRISLQEPIHTLSGVIDTPDSESPDLFPQSVNLVIIIYRHNSYHS